MPRVQVRPLALSGLTSPGCGVSGSARISSSVRACDTIRSSNSAGDSYDSRMKIGSPQCGQAVDRVDSKTFPQKHAMVMRGTLGCCLGCEWSSLWVTYPKFAVFRSAHVT